MFGNNSQALIHLSGGKPAPKCDVQLPRGECTFILNESCTEKSASQRCSCRSFFPADSVVRSTCGCGHQAWHHEAEPLSKITMKEHLAVIEEVKRLRVRVERFERLEHELRKEKMVREEHNKLQKGAEQRMYENMRLLKVHMDDKVEAVVDKTQEFNDSIKVVQERLAMVDEVTMDLENRLDRLENPPSLPSRHATPGASTPKATPKLALPPPPVPQLPFLMQPQSTLGPLPIRDRKYPLSWSVRVIFVPRKGMKFAYDPDSNGYRRCASRNLQQNLDFTDQSTSSLSNIIENAFKAIFRSRPWMPLVGHRPSDEPFGRMALRPLPQDLLHRDIWDYPFLEDHCIAHDKLQGDILYIALQYEDVTWNEIRFLPAVASADETCWAHDEELDGSAKFKSLDEEIMYEYTDPPPTYSSRTHSLADRHALADRAPSKLDVLADSASMLARVSVDSASVRHSVHSLPSIRTQLSPQSSRSTRSFGVSDRTTGSSSLRSFSTASTTSTTGESDDEHRDKKPKLRGKQSLPGISHGHGHGHGHSHAQPIYLSGRSKRKMPVRDKGPKEPLHFSVTNVTKWRPAMPGMQAILHPHGKGKETAGEASG